MKKINTEYLKENPIGTACGLTDNTALSNESVIDFIDTYFGGEIHVDDEQSVFEIRVKIQKAITTSEYRNFREDVEGLDEFIKEFFGGFKIVKDNANIIGTIFMFLIDEADGSARYEEDYLDENGMLFFEVE